MFHSEKIQEYVNEFIFLVDFADLFRVLFL